MVGGGGGGGGGGMGGAWYAESSMNSICGLRAVGEVAAVPSAEKGLRANRGARAKIGGLGKNAGLAASVIHPRPLDWIKAKDCDRTHARATSSNQSIDRPRPDAMQATVCSGRGAGARAG